MAELIATAISVVLGTLAIIGIFILAKESDDDGA